MVLRLEGKQGLFKRDTGPHIAGAQTQGNCIANVLNAELQDAGLSTLLRRHWLIGPGLLHSNGVLVIQKSSGNRRDLDISQPQPGIGM